MAHTSWIGLAVSGKWLDVGSHPQPETRRFSNTDAGIADLLTRPATRPVSGVAM